MWGWFVDSLGLFLDVRLRTLLVGLGEDRRVKMDGSSSRKNSSTGRLPIWVIWLVLLPLISRSSRTTTLNSPPTLSNRSNGGSYVPRPPITRKRPTSSSIQPPRPVFSISYTFGIITPPTRLIRMDISLRSTPRFGSSGPSFLLIKTIRRLYGSLRLGMGGNWSGM